MRKWYQKSMAVLTAAACLFAGGTIGLARDSLPQLQLTAEAEDKIYTGESDGLQLEYKELDDGTVEITRFASATSTNIELPSTIDGRSVTSIGDGAFCADDNVYNIEACRNLTSIVIPDSVTSIGDGAFYKCTSLTEIVVDSNNKSYTSKEGILCDKNLETIICCPRGKSGNFTIPDSVTSIADSAFEGCESLTSVIIPDSVTSIGDSAFRYCTSLTDVTIPDSVTSMGDWAFEYCTSLISVIISNSVTSIGDGAFYNCTNLTDVTIPDSVTSIDYEAFYNCTNLTSITISDSVTSIENRVFKGCTSLTEIIVDYNNKSYISKDGVLLDKNLETIICCPGGKAGNFTIPDSVTSIEDYAFYNCTSLTDVTIPDSVTSIGYEAFYNCTSLTDVMIPDSVINIGDSAFYNCTSLTDVTIPDSVTSIGNRAFSSCTSLTNVTIPDSVINIGNSAFYNCTSLTDIIIPDSVTSIGWYAFEYCSSLIDITIPKSITSIGSSAFNGCDSLTDIYYSGTESEWNEISIGGSAIPSNVTIHYESEPVTTTTTTTTTTKTITTTTSTTTTISEDTIAYGDVNTDNVVDLRDTIALNKYLANIIQFSDVQMANADCYKDGNLDEKDASTLMQFVISLIQDIPVIEE